MNYQNLLLCYFQRQPFVSLAESDDFKRQSYHLQMMITFLDTFMEQLKTCIESVVLAAEPDLRNQLGFELSMAQAIQNSVREELYLLINAPVISPAEIIDAHRQGKLIDFALTDQYAVKEILSKRHQELTAIDAKTDQDYEEMAQITDCLAFVTDLLSGYQAWRREKFSGPIQPGLSPLL